jgi:hypothetical protein
MRKINRGDIVICSTDELPWGSKNDRIFEGTNVIVGHKYVVRDIIEMSEKSILDVEHLSSSKRIGLMHERHFITLDVWREFQLRKIIV